jgi:predicted metal-dependent hydrolase
MPPAPSEPTIRIDRRAKRISLRLSAHGEAVLTLPHKRFTAGGLRFFAQKQEWLEEQRSRLPQPVPFLDGSRIPVAGIPHRISLSAAAHDPVRASDGLLLVGGRPETIAGLVERWLRAEARRALTEAVDRYSAVLALNPPPLSLRDPKTRWGSCSSRGRLSFSWRLAMAPTAVLHYVAAHEVAHLREVNHSHRFWELVAELMPGYAAQEAWLKRHGQDLHRYGG